MSSIHSNVEQGFEVVGSSSPVAVKRFTEERLSMRRSGKVPFHFITVREQVDMFYLHYSMLNF